MTSRRFHLALLLAAPLTLTGCFEIDQHLTLKKDGSATLRIQLAVSEQRLQRLRDLPNKKGSTPDELFDEKVFRETTTKKGGTVESYKSWTEKETRQLDTMVALKDAETMAKSGAFGDKAEVVFLGGPEGLVRMVIYPNGRKDHDIALKRNAEADALEQKPEGKEAVEFQERMFEAMRQDLKGLKVAWHFTMPGAIKSVSEGGTIEKSGDTASFAITDEQLQKPKDMRRLDAMKLEIVFDGKDCKLPVTESATKPAPTPASAESREAEKK